MGFSKGGEAGSYKGKPNDNRCARVSVLTFVKMEKIKNCKNVPKRKFAGMRKMWRTGKQKKKDLWPGGLKGGERKRRVTKRDRRERRGEKPSGASGGLIGKKEEVNSY